MSKINGESPKFKSPRICFLAT